MEVSAGEFKARCLNLMDEVQRTRREIVITKRGRPVAKLVPADEKPKSVWGALKGRATVVGDVRRMIEPIDERWDADQ